MLRWWWNTLLSAFYALLGRQGQMFPLQNRMSLIKLSITLPASASKLDQSGRCSTQSVYVGVSPSEHCRFSFCTLRINFLIGLVVRCESEISSFDKQK